MVRAHEFSQIFSKFDDTASELLLEHRVFFVFPEPDASRRDLWVMSSHFR